MLLRFLGWLYEKFKSADTCTNTLCFSCIATTIRTPFKPENSLNVFDECFTDDMLCGIWILEFTAHPKEIGNLAHV